MERACTTFTVVPPKPSAAPRAARRPLPGRPDTLAADIVARAHRLPPLRHGARWTVTPGSDPYRVRVADGGERMRLYDARSGDNVLFIQFRAGHPRLMPPPEIVYLLLAYTRPRTGHARNSWSLTEIPEQDGFAWVLTSRVIDPSHMSPQTRHALSRKLSGTGGIGPVEQARRAANELIAATTLYEGRQDPVKLLKQAFNTSP